MKRSLRTKNSTKIFIAATIVAAVAFGVSQLLLCCTDSGEVIAKVNGKRIYKSQVEQKLSLLLGGNPHQSIDLPTAQDLPSEVIKVIAKEVYLDEELTKLAKKSAVVKTKAVKRKINEAKKAIMRQAYLDSLIEKKVTDETIGEKYSELTSELQNKKEYLISHVIVKSEKEAEKIAYRLKRKYLSFANAAKKYSLDPESAADGGSLGFVIESSLIQEIADEIVKMEKNQVSAPIKTKFGWHLVMFSEIRDAEALPFEDVKSNIRQQLIKDTLDQAKENIIKNVKIEIIAKAQDAPESAKNTQDSNKASSKKLEKKSDASKKSSSKK